MPNTFEPVAADINCLLRRLNIPVDTAKASRPLSIELNRERSGVVTEAGANYFNWQFDYRRNRKVVGRRVVAEIDAGSHTELAYWLGRSAAAGEIKEDRQQQLELHRGKGQLLVSRHYRKYDALAAVKLDVASGLRTATLPDDYFYILQADTDSLGPFVVSRMHCGIDVDPEAYQIVVSPGSETIELLNRATVTTPPNFWETAT